MRNLARGLTAEFPYTGSNEHFLLQLDSSQAPRFPEPNTAFLASRLDLSYFGWKISRGAMHRSGSFRSLAANDDHPLIFRGKLHLPQAKWDISYGFAKARSKRPLLDVGFVPLYAEISNFLSKGRGHEYFNFRGFLEPRSSHSLVSSLSLPSVPPALSQKPRRQTARVKLLPISNGPAAAAASVVCCSDLWNYLMFRILA